jgi:hypothetical protein
MEERFSLHLVFPTASQGNELSQAGKVRGLTTGQVPRADPQGTKLQESGAVMLEKWNQAGEPGV